jgi:hypothetical protein
VFYLSGVKAVALTTALVLTVISVVRIIALIFGLVDYFSIDRFLEIVGAIGRLISFLTVVVRLFRGRILRSR